MSRNLIGQVVSANASKTVTIKVDRRVTHQIYKKQFTKSNKFSVHDEKSQAALGDIVEVESIRPVSKTKSWSLVKVVEKAKMLGGEK